MNNWEDDLYDDRGGSEFDRFDDHDSGEDEDRMADENFDGDIDPFRGEMQDDEDPFRGEIQDDDIDFRPDFKQMQQMIGDRGRGTTLAPGASKRSQKAMRTVEDTIRDQLRGVLSSDVYSGMSETKKTTILEQAESFKSIALVHLETLVQAFVWKMENKTLNKKNFADFAKKYIISDQISLLIYIRLITIGGAK
jgi:hypothetical protein